MSWFKEGGKEQNLSPPPAPRAEGPTLSPPRASPSAVPPPQPPARLKDREALPESPPSNETAIAAGMVVEGKIQGTTDLRIAGTFKGDLTLQGMLTVDAGGLVVGNVSAKSVVLGGQIQGNITAVVGVTIRGSGVLRGDLKASLFVAEAGAQMCGRAEFGMTE